MTPSTLQDSLVKDLGEELKGIALKNANGDFVGLNIYPQNLPAKKGQKDTDHFPYILIRINNGEIQETAADEEETCQIDFIIGTYDDTDNYQGFKDVMNVLQSIKQRLRTKKFYESRFELINPLKWLVHDEDTFPYYFGGMETHWNMPIINMDDDLV